VNNGSIISHGVNLGEFSSVGPSVTIAGNTTIGKTTTIGMGSNVIQNRNIGSNVMIGTGSTVITDIPNDQIAYGVPAKFADKKK
jgi:acetyltransferase-like isoleucine patch superfamily enzyme